MMSKIMTFERLRVTRQACNPSSPKPRVGRHARLVCWRKGNPRPTESPAPQKPHAPSQAISLGSSEAFVENKAATPSLTSGARAARRPRAQPWLA
eukprot:6201394-Pleurochrysis_carterae.AAC.2